MDQKKKLALLVMEIKTHLCITKFDLIKELIYDYKDDGIIRLATFSHKFGTYNQQKISKVLCLHFDVYATIEWEWCIVNIFLNTKDAIY